MKYILSVIILIMAIGYGFCQKVIFTEDFESGKLSKSWSITENCTQKLESDTVYRPYQAISYSLMGECEERCVMSHTLREPELENMIISDKLAISFVYRATEADYVSCEIHTDKGVYQKTFAPVSLNTWNEVTVTVKDFQPTENQGDLAGKKLKGGISFSMCGKGTFIIDNVNISVSKNINIETDKNFIPIYARDNFAKITVTVYDEYGKEIKDGTEVTMSCDNGSFDKNPAKTKNGKASFIYTPGEKAGLLNITATVDKDTASLPVVTVPGVKTIDFDFPKNTSADREEYSATLAPNTKILKFTGNPTEKLRIKGSSFYVYINGSLTDTEIAETENYFITKTKNIPATGIITLILKDYKSDSISVSGIDNIKEITCSAKEVWEEKDGFLTSLSGTQAKGKYQKAKSENNIALTSLLAEDYFILKNNSALIKAEITNLGTLPANNIKTALTDRDGNIISVSEIPYLAPNSAETAEFEVKQENLGYTSYYAVADYENLIKETDKKDNILPLPMDILCYEEKTPSLEIKNLKATVSGNSVTAEGETNETGDGYITFKHENALYYVHNFTCDGNINETVSLPSDIPTGVYTIEAGIYGKEPVNHITVSAEIKTSAKNTRKPMGYGTFTDMEKVPHFWYINHANMLMWEGKPYFTFGYMFVGTNFVPEGNSAKPVGTYDAIMEELLVMQGVNACGITDMENTAKIKPYMEQAGMTYSAFAGEGNVIYWMKYPLDSYLVKNGKYMTDLTDGKGEYTFTDLNGETIKGYHILIYDLTDSRPIECIQTETDQTKIDISVTKPEPGHNYRAYITPRIMGGHTIHDYWSAWEDRLEFAKEAIAKQKYPKGVRYAIDPFENEEGFFFNNDPYKIPVSDAYLKTFEEYLRNKYKDTEKLKEAWSVTEGNIKDFSSATRLTPLQIIGENSYLYNNTENTVITLNAKRSLYWYDTLDARDTSLLKLHNEYADWFKQYCNVPIVSKRVGGHSKAFTADTVNGGFDGVAVDCYNLKTKINKVTGSFLADIEDSPKTCWFPTLEINYETPSTTKPTECWPDETVMREDFARFLEMGVRGFNIFALDLRNTAEDVFAWPKFDAMLHPYQIEWYKNIKTDILNNIDRLENLKPKVGYIYPTLEPELNAFVYNNRSHSGLGWSSTQAKNGYWFIPTNNFNHNNLTVCSLPDYPISRVYGEKLNTAIKENKCPILYVGLRKDLGQIPALDTYFTEEFFTVHNSYGDVTCQKLDPKDGFRPILEKDGAVYGMERDGLTIIAMDTDPVLYTEKENLPMKAETEDISREILGVSSSTENTGSNLTEKDFTLDETGRYIYLSEINPAYAKQGWGVLEYDHNLDMGPLGCKGIKFAHGLASHAPAEIIYNLEGKYKKFACFIGIADVYTDMGSVTYEIFADGKNIFSSGLVKGSDLPRKLELDIQGVNELKFIIGDGGDSNHADHASLFEARLYY